MSEPHRPSRFPRKDYSQLNSFGLDSERLRTLGPNPLGDSGESNDEFMAEPSDNETSEDQMGSQIDSQRNTQMDSLPY